MNINYTPEQGKTCLEIENAELRKENQRLNNVLNEIYNDLMFDYKDLNVEDLKEKEDCLCSLSDSYWQGYISACEEVFDKLKELKESDK